METEGATEDMSKKGQATSTRIAPGTVRPLVKSLEGAPGKLAVFIKGRLLCNYDRNGMPTGEYRGWDERGRRLKSAK